MENEILELQPAAQYIRVSTEMQRYSSHHQKLIISEYAKRNGFTVVKTYEDENKSGVTTKGREGLGAMLSEVFQTGTPFEAILVLDVSRWGRYQDPDEAAHYEFLCKSSGVPVHYCAENFEQGVAGSIVKQLKRVMAAEYSRELSVKVSRAKQNLMRLGFVQGGMCPFGIARVEVMPSGSLGKVLRRCERKTRPEHSLRYVPGDPDEIAVAKQIFALFVRAKLAPAEIARRLNREGLAYYDGRPWTFQHVRRILDCELLTGRQSFGKTTSFLNDARVKIPSSDWISSQAFPPIISRKMFLAAARQREWRRANRRRSDQALLEDLRRVRARHGKINTALIDAAPDCSHSSYYDKRFGSLGRALVLIDDSPRLNRRGDMLGHPIPRADLIEILQRLEKSHGGIAVRLFRETPGIPSYQTFCRQFGSMKAACQIAGVRQFTRSEAVKLPRPLR